MWEGEQMPTEAGAGMVFGKAGERRHATVIQERHRVIQGGKGRRGGEEPEIRHSDSIQSPVTAFLCQSANSHHFLGRVFNFHVNV